MPSNNSNTNASRPTSKKSSSIGSWIKTTFTAKKAKNNPVSLIDPTFSNTFPGDSAAEIGRQRSNSIGSAGGVSAMSDAYTQDMDAKMKQGTHISQQTMFGSKVFGQDLGENLNQDPRRLN